MGNELFSEYSIDKNPFLSGGYLNLWKVYKGSHKERKQNVCIFVCEKKTLDRFPKQEYEDIISTLKKEANSLVKFKHPSILGIVEPLIEDKYSLGFITEEFSFTLTSWLTSINPSKLEIKLMITELCKVVQFLHNDAHVIHTNLNPDVIFIDRENKIKISGMNFSINDPPMTGGDITISPTTTPNLKYSAPEIVYNFKSYYSSDIYSLGLIIYMMLKYHRGDSERELLNLSMNTIDSYKTYYTFVESKLKKMNFESDDISLINSLLLKEHSMRPSIKNMVDHQWFNDPKLKALCFVENLASNDMSKNIEFLQKFPNIITMFETKLITKRFLPSLLTALKNELMINAALPCIFTICEIENGTKVSFVNEVWPKVKELFTMKSMPAASLYYLLSKVEFIGEKISNVEFSGTFLSLICKALDCNVVKIQSVVINKMNFITKKIDSLLFKNQIYPRIVQIILTTKDSNFKVQTLKCLKSLYNLLDQTLINESLLSNMEKIRKSDINNKSVCVAVLDLYEDIAKVVNIESIANKILPNLIALLVSGQITRSVFDKTMGLIHSYLERIKKVREKDLADDVSSDTSTVGSVGSNDVLGGLMPSTKVGSGDFLTDFFEGNKGGNVVGQSGDVGLIIPKQITPLDIGVGVDGGSKIGGNGNEMGFDFSSSNTSSKPTNQSGNLFAGLNTNVQGNMNSNNPMDLFSNVNTSKQSQTLSSSTGQFPFDVTTSSKTSDPFSSFNLTATNASSSSQQHTKKYDARLDNLLNDLPSSSGMPSTTTSNNNNNPLSSMQFNFTTTTTTNTGNMMNSNSGGGFNQNSLDFLTRNTQNTSIPQQMNNNQQFNFNNFSFGNQPHQQQQQHSQNTNDIFSQFNNQNIFK